MTTGKSRSHVPQPAATGIPGCQNGGVSLMSSARRLDDRAHAIWVSGSLDGGRQIVARVCAFAAVPSGLFPCAYLLNDPGADRSGVLVLTVVVAAGLVLANLGGLTRTLRFAAPAGAALLWAISLVGIFVNYVFIPAAVLASAAALLGAAPPRR